MHVLTFMPDEEHRLSEKLRDVRILRSKSLNYCTFGIKRRQDILVKIKSMLLAAKEDAIKCLKEDFPAYNDMEVKFAYNRNNQSQRGRMEFVIKIPYIS